MKPSFEFTIHLHRRHIATLTIADFLDGPSATRLAVAMAREVGGELSYRVPSKMGPSPIVDPLKTLDMREVVARTGIPKFAIYKALAKDEMNGTPGHNFAAPIRHGDRKKLRWRELTVVRWMEKNESQ